MIDDVTEEDVERMYRQVYNEASDRLMSIALRLQSRLLPRDVAGVLVSVAIESLKMHEPKPEITTWLRTVADAVEAGTVGLEKDRTVN